MSSILSATLVYEFTIVEQDHYMYVKRSKEGFLILTLYKNDIHIALNDKRLVEETMR